MKKRTPCLPGDVGGEWKGTQTGPFVGEAGTIPPSGKSQTTPFAFLFDFDGDKIAEGRISFDMLSFLQQIGAIPG